MKLQTTPFFVLLCSCLLAATSFAQVPQSFHYQAVARDASGELLANHTISVRIDIVQGSESGEVVYSETHSATTNDAGLFTLEIGAGTKVSAGEFTEVDWTADNYFLTIAVDINAGANYETLGASKLLSVPYAIVAQRAVTADSAAGFSTEIVLNSDEADSSVTISSTGSTSRTPLVVSAGTEGENISVVGNALSEPANANMQVGVNGNADGSGTGLHIGVFGSALNDDGTIGRRYGLYGQASSQGRENIGAFGLGIGAGDVVLIDQEVNGNIGGFNIGTVGFARSNLNGNLGVRGRAYGTEGARINVGVNGTAEATATGWNVGVESYASNSQSENVGFLGRVLGTGAENYGLRLHVHNRTSNTGLAVYADDVAASFNAPLTEVNGNLTVNGDINYSGTLTSTSDRNLKENIQPLRNAWTPLCSCRPPASTSATIGQRQA